MPYPHQKRLVLANESLYSAKLRARKATAPLQAYRIEPELGLGFLPLHVDMGRFVPIRRVEKEPVWPGSKNCRQSFQCTRPAGELLEQAAPEAGPSPLAQMNAAERLYADFRNTGLTIGAHPMRFHRQRMNQLRVTPASQVKRLRDGCLVRVAGAVICRQRPGTAKGFLFLSLEDETGISNAIVQPDLFESARVTLVSEPYLLIEGVLQNQQGVVSVKAGRVEPLEIDAAGVESHDFR